MMTLRRSTATRQPGSNAKRASSRSPEPVLFCGRHHRRARRREQGQNAGQGAIAVIIGVSASSPAALGWRLELSDFSSRIGSTMPMVHQGGCLCGEVRYRTTSAPVHVTICHCTFCQRMTGSAYLVEPILLRAKWRHAAVGLQALRQACDASRPRAEPALCAGPCAARATRQARWFQSRMRLE